MAEPSASVRTPVKPPASKPSASVRTPVKPPASKPSASVRTPVKPPASKTVRAGAFCSQAGTRGRTATGKAMTCKTKPGDDRLRWRS